MVWANLWQIMTDHILGLKLTKQNLKPVNKKLMDLRKLQIVEKLSC